MIKTEALKEINNKVVELIAQLEAVKQDVKYEASTNSIAQDALRLGFQTTCASGIAQLFGIKDMTVEACKNFMPRHEQDVQAGIAQVNKKYGEFCNTYYDEVSKHLKRNLRTDFRWYQFFNKVKSKQDEKKINAVLKTVQLPTFTVKVSKSKVDIPNGKIETDIIVTLNYQSEGSIYRAFDTEPLNTNRTKIYKHEVITIAKRGAVEYEPYIGYSRTYIPDEVVEVVKEALAIGLTDIQVCYPTIQTGVGKDGVIGLSGKPFNADPFNADPIVVGYLKTEKRQDMYMLAWFGYDVTQSMTCNI